MGVCKMGAKNKGFPPTEKQTTKHVVGAKPNSNISDTPIWRFDKLDRDGQFAFDLSRYDFKHQEVLTKLIEYGNLTWGVIFAQTHDKCKSKHHYLDCSGLSSEAKKRIRAKHLEQDTDRLFSFALQNTLRIIGIRDGAEFHIVWYDPNHEFYPSEK